MLDTKQKILDAAVDLIAERGYGATSLRHIIAKAGVNLAAIHYHFGSKEELLDELISWKVAPINSERLERLEKVKAEAAPNPPPSEAVLRAFLEPMAQAGEKNPQFVRVMGRIMSEGLLPAVIQKHFMPTLDRFVQLLRPMLPEMAEEEFQWRMRFTIGAIAHTTVCYASEGQGEFHKRIEYLIRFAHAGLVAPAGQPQEVNP